MQSDPYEESLERHRATLRHGLFLSPNLGLVRGRPGADGWLKSIDLSNGGRYFPAMLFGWNLESDWHGYEHQVEFTRSLRTEGGYGRLLQLESNLIRTEQSVRDSLKTQLEGIVNPFLPDVLHADAYLGAVLTGLVGIGAADVARLPDMTGADHVAVALRAAFLFLQVDVRSKTFTTQFSHPESVEHLSDLNFVWPLSKALGLACAFEELSDRLSSLQHVLTCYEVFGPSAGALGVWYGEEQHAERVGSRQAIEPEEPSDAARRAHSMGIALVDYVLAHGTTPDFGGGTNEGFLEWCGDVIGKSKATVRTVLEDVAVGVIRGEKKQGATGHAVSIWLRRLLAYTVGLNPELRTQIARVENVVLDTYDAATEPTCAAENGRVQR